MEIILMKGNFDYSFWKSGSYGFGLGIWRTNFITSYIWTIALGPLSIYYIIPRTIQPSK